MGKYEIICGSVVNISKVKEIEKELNISFPESYVEFITVNNGSSILPNAFRVGNAVESINNFQNVEESYRFKDERLPDRVVPFARDAGDNKICFDFRTSGKVSILFWDYEIEIIDDGALKFVSDSFEDFLDTLFEFDE